MLDWTLIAVAVIGAIPALLAFRKSVKTAKSVELAGSEVTVANWNKLIKNLYEEIERQDTQLQVERDRAKKREAELLEKIKTMEKEHEEEKREYLAEIQHLNDQLVDLKRRVEQTLKKAPENVI